MKRGMSRFFSILLIITLMLGMIPFSPHHEHAHAATPGTLYFKSNGWESDGARIEAYFFGGSSGDKWVTMTNLGNGYFECSAPTSGYPNVIFVRMNPNGAEHSWDSKWNQTADLTLPTNGKDCFSVSGWDNAGGSWEYYVCLTGTHNYAAATCTTAKTCTNCSATSGSALGHSWSSSTGKCSACGTACSHSWNSGTVTKAATCAATGVMTYTCNTCKTTKTETIPKTTTHSYGNAGCNAPATCSVCGKTTGSALGHDYSYKVTKNPTTSASGTLVGTCTRCSASTGNITIGYLGTQYHTYKVIKAATCTAAGTGRYTWGITDYGTYYWDVSIPATGHSYTSKVTAPTCTAQGYTIYTCSCGNSYKDNYTNAKGHSWDASTGKCGSCGTACSHSWNSGSVTKEPTCTANGVRTYTCSTCKTTKTESVAATGHSYSGGKCGSCGDTKVVSLPGSFNDWNTGANMTWSSGGYTLTLTLPAGTYTFKVLKDGAWLGNNGEIWDTTTATSSVGWEFVDGYNDCVLVATGGTYTFTFHYDTNMLVVSFNHSHKYNAGEVVKPTCTEKGYTVYTCACGDSYHGDETAALGHKYSGSVTTQPGCTTEGVETFTCGTCGDGYTEKISSTGHSYSAVVTAPTCTAQGYTTHTCGTCGDSYKDTYKDATGHSYVNGTCANCGEGCEHNWGTGSVTTQPGCTTEGVETFTCSLCKHTKTESIAAAGHSYSSVVTKPTCTAQGYTTYTCANCSDTYKADYTDAKGHSYVAGKCFACGDQLSLYLVGWVNGADYDGTDYKFVGGKLVVTFTDATYVAVKAGTNWYMLPAYVDTTSATFYPANENCNEKMFVPVGAELTFTLSVGSGDSFVLSYEISDCPHDYTSEQTKVPTCTDKGELTYTCSICGNTYTEEIAALGHSYESKVTAPTCTEGGYTTYTCACGDSYVDDYTDPTGHHFGDDEICDVCGYASSVEYMTVYFRNDWLWSNVSLYYWGSTGTDNPGWPGIPMELHGNDGTYDVYKLTVPTDITGMLINGTNSEGAANQSPDIMGGWYDGICYYMFWDGENKVLSESIEIILPPECRHTNTTPVAGKDATCTEPGLSQGSVCADCGKAVVEQTEIPALGHSYIAGICGSCGDRLSYYLIGFINGADYEGDEYLFVDGKLTVIFTEGSYVAIKVGTYWYNTSEFVEGATSATFYPATESIFEKLYVPANVEVTFTLTVGQGDSLVLSYVTGDCRHSYESAVTEPTCTAGGYTTHTCAYCGNSYTDSETQALGHNYVDGTCDRCGEAEPVVNYITVYFRNNWLWTNVHAYVFVGEAYVAPWPGEPATLYGNDGEFDVYCVTIPEGASVIFNGTKNDGSGASDQTPDIANAADGDCYSMILIDDNAVEKDHIDNVIKPECTHTNTTPVAGKNATCTEPGLSQGSVCADCGKTVVEQTEIPALGHSYGDDEICDVCGETKPSQYMTIYFRNDWLWSNVSLYYWGSTIAENPAWNGIAMELYGNDGQYDIYKLTVPTDITGMLINGINTDGAEAKSPDVTGGWYDGICYYMFWDGADQVLNDSIDNILPDVCEHEYDIVINEATCTADGSVISTCKLCGDVKTETLPATGHSYVGGVCHCGAATDGVTIHLINTLGWSGTVVYAWENSTSTALSGWSWPGKIIHKDNEDDFTFHVDYEPGSGKTLGLLFHNFNGAQTVDILIDYATLSTSREIWIKPNASANADGKYACTVAGSESGLVVSPEVNGNQVTFRYAGNASSVFLAGSFNNWSTSASALTKGDDGIWTVTLDLNAGVHEYKFVVDGAWVTDPVNGVVGGYDGNSIVVVPADDEIANDGKVTVVLHFYRASGDYSGWDVWFWSNPANGTSAAFSADPNNKGMIATFTVDGSSTSSVGYVIRKSDWSDKEFGDRFIDLTDVSSGTVHYFVNSGSATGSRVLGEDIISHAKLVYANYNYEADTVWLKTSLPVSNPVASAFSIVDSDGNATSIRVTGVTLSGNGYTLTLSNGLTLSQLNSYKVRYNGCDVTISINTHDLFYSSKFASDYTYYGDDLGATWSYGSTTFKVWAPTAKAVSVKIYGSGNWGANDLLQNVSMTQGEKGVWYVTVSGNLHGKYYNYDVSFEGYTVEATDPYAKGTGANGDRGMIVNMDATDPSGWDNDVSPNKGMSYTDAIIYETHIREFTIDASSGVDADYRGKYLGLTQTGTSYMGHSTGLDYLKQLGITHIQLMPTYDFASIDEYHLTDWQQYAWGYDPKNFSVPEGSYATDPYNGLTRITEFKEMVQTFHENGINVVMDVVFNHTFDGGNYCGNKIVPNYYSRFFGEGNWSNGSGVGNDFATERGMVRNLIVDNVLYWVEEYHIDGFRFDLAGLIDVQTVNEIVSTVHAKYPYVIFYGEGWAPGGTAVQDGHDLATKGNAWQTPGFGYFNDDYRNAIAGNNGGSWGFASGSWDFEDVIANYFRAGNSFSSSPSQTINYVSCHDNYCLTDKLLISRDGAYWSEIVRMNSLSNALVLLSEGIPFIYSGEEMFREKKDANGNRYDNAYGTNDDINKILWSDLVNKQYADVVSDYYAGLIAFRKNHAALRSNNNGYIYSDVTFHRLSDQTILFYINGALNGDCADGIVVIFNAGSSHVNVNLTDYVPDGYWQACIHGDQAGITPLWGVDVSDSSGNIGVEAISTTVLVLGDLVDENSIYNRQSSNCSHANHNTSAMCTSCGKTVSHSYVGGTCSVCGLSSSAPSTYTVYFNNSEAGWDTVNIYAWTETAGMIKEYAGNWPGSTMTLVDEVGGIWGYELPIGASNIIFNDGSGSQTSNLTAPGYTSDKLFYSDGAWISYEACAHEYEDTVNIEATCTMDGEVTHTCTLCGYSYTEIVEAKGHDITDVVTEPTCTTGGYTTHACTICGDSYVDTETEALGHSYGEDGICTGCGKVNLETCQHEYESVITEPTCTKPGFTTYTCTICGDSYVGDETAVVGHSYGEDGFCGVCGAEKPSEYMTIYFRNDWLWTNVYLYYWIDGVETPAWPGTAMELCGNDGTYDIYKLTIPTDITGLIINGTNTDGITDQTPDITEGWYDGICYYMFWDGENKVLSESIESVLPSKPVIKPDITVGNPSVSFEGEIRYNFYFLVDDMSSVEEMGIALFKEKVADGTVSTAFQVISTYYSEDGIYMVQTDGIAPKNMADAVYFRIYTKLTDGTYVYTDIRGYNAVVYANNILKKSESAEMKALVVALLNYGAEAQKFFNYNADALMNAHLTAQQQALVQAYDESMVDPVLAVDMNKVGIFAKTDSGFTDRKPSVSFDGAFSINYYMTTAFVPEGDVKMYVWRLEDYLSAEVLTAENATECVTMVATGIENQYWANVSDIVAKQVDQTVFVACVYTSGGVEYCTGVLNYSVGAYCESNLTVEDAMNGLCAGAAVYSYYAKQYFAGLEENA